MLNCHETVKHSQLRLNWK